MMSAMMIGLDVAPEAPRARLRATSSGSTESSHSLVPLAIRLCSGVVMAHSCESCSGYLATSAAATQSFYEISGKGCEGFVREDEPGWDGLRNSIQAKTWVP